MSHRAVMTAAAVGAGATAAALLVTACGDASRAPAEHPQQASRREEGPPGGLGPCRAPGSHDPVAAAQYCWTTRVRPGLVDLTKSPRCDDFRFGSREYLGHALAIPPRFELDPSATLPVLPPAVLVPSTALGSHATAQGRAKLTAVLLTLREPGMPTDGDIQLVFFVDASLFETVFVYRILNG